MSDEIEPTSSEGPTAPKTDRMAKAREAKAAKRTQASAAVTDDRDELIAMMGRQIAALQSAMLEHGKQRFEQQQSTLDVIPAASPELPPGTYIQIGLDGNGAPIMGKIRHTRQWIIDNYKSVTFVPKRDMDVGPHEIGRASCRERV